MIIISFLLSFVLFKSQKLINSVYSIRNPIKMVIGIILKLIFENYLLNDYTPSYS